MELRRLLQRVSGSVTWDVLRLLMNQVHSIEDLADRIGVTKSTVRSHLSRLRHDGFVEAKKSSRPKTYGIVDERSLPVQLVLSLIQVDESVNLFDPETVSEMVSGLDQSETQLDLKQFINTISKFYPHPGLTPPRAARDK